jgi:hypothetical protein
MVGGTVGLLAVCLLVLTFTPDRDESPVAVSATTTPSGPGGVRVLSGISAIGRFASEDDDDGATVRVQPAIATPIGDGRSALVTRAAIRATDDAFDVQLASGVIVEAAVMSTTPAGLVVVTIAVSDTAHDLADELPEPDEIVTVLTETPMTVPFGDIDELDLAEGTPVLDAEGALVGLCTRTHGRATVVAVSGTSTTTTIAATTTEPAVESTAPTTEPTVESTEPTAPSSSGAPVGTTAPPPATPPDAP